MEDMLYSLKSKHCTSPRRGGGKNIGAPFLGLLLSYQNASASVIMVCG